jgi:hypothetical protein
VDGGAGRDTANYDQASASVTINLLAGTATGAMHRHRHADSIESGQAAGSTTRSRWQRAGSATGRGGNDTLIGGSGDDFSSAAAATTA